MVSQATVIEHTRRDHDHGYKFGRQAFKPNLSFSTRNYKLQVQLLFSIVSLKTQYVLLRISVTFTTTNSISQTDISRNLLEKNDDFDGIYRTRRNI